MSRPNSTDEGRLQLPLQPGKSVIETSESLERRPQLEDFLHLADNLPEAAWIADAEGNVF